MVIALLTLTHWFGWLRPIENLVVYITRPVTSTVFHASGNIGNAVRFFASIGKLADENNDLQKKVEQLSSENAKLREVERENVALREQLHFTEKQKFVSEPSFVIGSDPTSFTEYLTIDKGNEAGIEVNDPVITENGILVGRIAEVGWKSSKVLLVIDSSSSVNAIVQESRASGVVRGEHGLGLRMDLIPQDKVIKTGDRVVTSGLGEIFPKGLVLGEIENVTQQENELFQTARISPLVSFHDIEIVFVIKEF